jgi:predicted methyltransferase
MSVISDSTSTNSTPRDAEDSSELTSGELAALAIGAHEGKGVNRSPYNNDGQIGERELANFSKLSARETAFLRRMDPSGDSKFMTKEELVKALDQGLITIDANGKISMTEKGKDAVAFANMRGDNDALATFAIGAHEGKGETGAPYDSDGQIGEHELSSFSGLSAKESAFLRRMDPSGDIEFMTKEELVMALDQGLITIDAEGKISMTEKGKEAVSGDRTNPSPPTGDLYARQSNGQMAKWDEATSSWKDVTNESWADYLATGQEDAALTVDTGEEVEVVIGDASDLDAPVVIEPPSVEPPMKGDFFIKVGDSTLAVTKQGEGENAYYDVREYDSEGKLVSSYTGDPHVDENGDGEWDWHFGNSSTFTLSNGATVNFETKAWNGDENAKVIDSMTVTTGGGSVTYSSQDENPVVGEDPREEEPTDPGDDTTISREELAKTSPEITDAEFEFLDHDSVMDENGERTLSADDLQHALEQGLIMIDAEGKISLTEKGKAAATAWFNEAQATLAIEAHEGKGGTGAPYDSDGQIGEHELSNYSGLSDRETAFLRRMDPNGDSKFMTKEELVMALEQGLITIDAEGKISMTEKGKEAVATFFDAKKEPTNEELADLAIDFYNGAAIA